MLEWNEYERRFRFTAKNATAKRRFDAGYVERCLSYARVLHDRRLPIIYDQLHLSQLVGYSLEYVLGAANAPRKFYRRFEIPKRSGATRVIREPLPSLKDIQRWILINILEIAPVHRFAKGFVRGRSIRDNARFHVGQPAVMKLDIRDFFGSIPYVRVRKLFSNLGYSFEVAVLLARLCTFRDGLPQGAPTSPAISNLLSYSLDQRISRYAIRRKIRYTRYADDLTFSGTFNVGELISFVSMVLADDGLELNESKTRFMEHHQQQKVTGVVLNSRMNAPREVRRELRQIVHYVGTFGLDAHLQNTRNARAGFVKHAIGLATYVLFLNPDDRDALRLKELFASLAREEL